MGQGRRARARYDDRDHPLPRQPARRRGRARPAARHRSRPGARDDARRRQAHGRPGRNPLAPTVVASGARSAVDLHDRAGRGTGDGHGRERGGLAPRRRRRRARRRSRSSTRSPNAASTPPSGRLQPAAAASRSRGSSRRTDPTPPPPVPPKPSRPSPSRRGLCRRSRSPCRRSPSRSRSRSRSAVPPKPKPATRKAADDAETRILRAPPGRAAAARRGQVHAARARSRTCRTAPSRRSTRTSRSRRRGSRCRPTRSSRPSRRRTRPARSRRRCRRSSSSGGRCPGSASRSRATSSLPWLALVVIAEGEGSLSAESKVEDCFTPGCRAAAPRRPRHGHERLPDRHPDGRGRRVSRPKDDVRLLAHVREVDVHDSELMGGDDDGFLAVVIANRLPQPGFDDKGRPVPKKYLACLINIEAQNDKLPPPPPDPMIDFFFDAGAGRAGPQRPGARVRGAPGQVRHGRAGAGQLARPHRPCAGRHGQGRGSHRAAAWSADAVEGRGGQRVGARPRTRRSACATRWPPTGASRSSCSSRRTASRCSRTGRSRSAATRRSRS